MHSLYLEVSESPSVCAVLTMRILGKFLGFLMFLPYQQPSPPFCLQSRNVCGETQVFLWLPYSPCVYVCTCGLCFRSMLSCHQFQASIMECMREAKSSGSLSVSVPWVVEYCSMMDRQALAVAVNRSLVCLLVKVYRLAGRTSSRSSFLVTASLGWLFEVCLLSEARHCCIFTVCVCVCVCVLVYVGAGVTVVLVLELFESWLTVICAFEKIVTFVCWLIMAPSHVPFCPAIWLLCLAAIHQQEKTQLLYCHHIP